MIEKIEGTTVTYRGGNFIQGKSDTKKKPVFKGTLPRTMSLSMLWAYLQSHPTFTLDEPIKKFTPKEEKDTGKMSWWNIFKHTHSL